MTQPINYQMQAYVIALNAVSGKTKVVIIDDSYETDLSEAFSEAFSEFHKHANRQCGAIPIPLTIKNRGPDINRGKGKSRRSYD